MFSGIIETTAPIRSLDKNFASIKISIERPMEFDDLAVGHSISVNGVCLTVESFDQEQMFFVIGAETCEVTNWQNTLAVGQSVNLERSLRLGERIHGHLVSGHVDECARVIEIHDLVESRKIQLKLDKPQRSLFWKKGSLTVNGVSLTVNEVSHDIVEFCIIPETLRRTNLSKLSVGDVVMIEYDYLAKLFLNSIDMAGARHALNT